MARGPKVAPGLNCGRGSTAYIFWSLDAMAVTRVYFYTRHSRALRGNFFWRGVWRPPRPPETLGHNDKSCILIISRYIFACTMNTQVSPFCTCPCRLHKFSNGCRTFFAYIYTKYMSKM